MCAYTHNSCHLCISQCPTCAKSTKVWKCPCDKMPRSPLFCDNTNTSSMYCICDWHRGIHKNKLWGSKFIESEPVFTLHSGQTELSFSALSREKTEAARVEQRQRSQLLWLLQWVVHWGSRAITGGSSWWEQHTFGECCDVSILWLPLSYQHKHTLSSLLAFTPAGFLLTCYHNTGHLYQSWSFSDAVFFGFVLCINMHFSYPDADNEC